MSVMQWIFGEPGGDIAKHLAASFKAASSAEDCCSVPETSCPPRCLEEVTWTIGRGASPRASMVVRNTAAEDRTFTFTATALSGMDVGATHLVVEPVSAHVPAGETREVSVELVGTVSLTPAQEYRAEIRFVGSFEQCVRTRVIVSPDAVASVDLNQCDAGDKSVKTSRRKANQRKHGSGKHKVNPRLTLGGFNEPVAELAWRVERGVAVEGLVRVTNSGCFAQTFELEATPCAGPGPGVATLDIVPSSLLIPAGKTRVARVRFADTASLSPAQDFVGELTVTGYRKDRVSLRLAIEPDPMVHIALEQGDFPTRVRAHHWYNHFQCIEDCSEFQRPKR